MAHIPSIRLYSTEIVVSSAWFFHFLTLIFLSFGIYTSFVCVYNLTRGLAGRTFANWWLRHSKRQHVFVRKLIRVMYNVRTSLFWRNKIIHCLISRRVSEKNRQFHTDASWKWKIMLFYRKTGHFSRSSKKQGNFILRLCAFCSSELGKVFFFDFRIECIF